jgi:hypothetical protein
VPTRYAPPGFIRRRQAHEALIHRVDAELAARSRSPMDLHLSANGVDEALRFMYGGDVPARGTFLAGSDTALQLQATDTADVWLVTVGQFTGTDPSDHATYDQLSIQVTGGPAATAAAGVRGRAADLDCWLWRRPPVLPIDRSGDAGLLSRFDSIIAPGIT